MKIKFCIDLNPFAAVAVGEEKVLVESSIDELPSIMRKIIHIYQAQHNLSMEETTMLIEHKPESRCPRPAKSETAVAKEASAVDKLYSLVFHDHPTQSIAHFVLKLF